MATAFQPNAFQNNAFQIEVEVEILRSRSSARLYLKEIKRDDEEIERILKMVSKYLTKF